MSRVRVPSPAFLLFAEISWPVDGQVHLPALFGYHPGWIRDGGRLEAWGFSPESWPEIWGGGALDGAMHHMTGRMRRRRWCGFLAAGAMAAATRSRADDRPTGGLPPARAITRGPRFHWRGYYDKLLFDPTDRFVLANQVEFEGRSPKADDTIRVGMIDTGDADRWIEPGSTRAWNWQQGCCLLYTSPSPRDLSTSRMPSSA